MKFKTSSGIKSIVGKDLITDRYVAIFELVKNSYDARATEVIVSFNTSEDSEEGVGSLDDGKIYIVDNGTGMSKADLDNKWLKLAYSDKQEGSLEENNSEDSLREVKNRVLVGSKGIGRFSSDSLGSVVVIRTKVKHEEIEHQLTVNWDDFDKDLKTLFEDVNLKYQENSLLSRTDVDSYTIIEISNLRNKWTEEQLDGVTEKLRRLKNPFVEDDNLKIYCGINVFKLNESSNLKKKDLVSSNIAEVLREKSINISATIKPYYKDIEINNYIEYINNYFTPVVYNIYLPFLIYNLKVIRSTIILEDRGEKIYKLERDEVSILKDLDHVRISINYLTVSAKSTFTRRMGVPAIRYGNIFVYRNGFHVSPYGEEHYDIFGLNLRKTQGYNRYLGTREIIGFINVEDSKNLLKETSSRNSGFIENGYFKSLEKFYIEDIHRPLERYVRLINWGETDNDDNTEVFLDDIEITANEKEKFKRYITRNNFKVIEFNSNLDFEKNKPEKIIERISNKIRNPDDNKKDLTDDTKTLEKQFKDLAKEKSIANKKAEKESKKNEALERQNRSLSSSRTETSYSQQVTHHFRKFSSRLRLSIQDLEKLKIYIPEKEISNFNNILRKISRTQYELTAFQELLTKTEVETRKGTLLNWIDFFKWHFNEKTCSDLIVTVNYASDIAYKNWNIYKTNAVEVLMMLENFYENASEHNATILDIMFYEDSFTVSSDSTPVPDNSLINIFELGFSTKTHGTGIGLNQISQFLKKSRMMIKASNIDNMVQFTISKVQK